MRSDGFFGKGSADSADENAFYESTVPTRIKDQIKSLAVYLWLCAALNLVIALLLGDTLSFTIAAADAVLAVFVRKRKAWAAVAGIVYSAGGAVIFTLYSILLGDGIGSTRVLLGWLASLALFVGAFRALKEIEKAFERFRETGIDPWDTPAERETEARLRKTGKKNRIIAWSAFGVLIAVLLSVFGVNAWKDAARYKNLDGGVWEGDTYTNAYFGLSYRLPSHWSRRSDETLKTDNEISYGGTNVKRHGGTLFVSEYAEDEDTVWTQICVSVIRQGNDRLTKEEILARWVSDKKTLQGVEYRDYSVGEIGTATIAEKEFAAVKETVVYEDGDGGREVREYTYVYQSGKYTLSIELSVYDPAMTEEDVSALLKDFTLLRPQD